MTTSVKTIQQIVYHGSALKIMMNGCFTSMSKFLHKSCLYNIKTHDVYSESNIAVVVIFSL